ncbi:hypothetical protein GUITHDRAFT_115597 [Guillardia theta CCMP2712]|uniref:RWP-RK domain-containing protein n=1 Tax=Guillardia theta (strain CCMP2712) TaxID=905079 RepID=L1IR09_GUITC|nr:hypothetical protein GUITHDRAFT_115597 [Guillardia theta CCMP2712]EKX38255.1 hypothetical protein GUITHDRAFT_115597 [Guillardia theta CCMP2712]|eukprot:XP_005825235.1 hypothetical protein GUITHDRAFT_115597 [Guillardia theta CCMP2712]
MEVKAASVRVCPRPRGSLLTYSPPPPVSLDQALVKSLFHLTQGEAAQTVGISLSSLKLACRRMGIRKWPYNRRCSSKRTDASSIPGRHDDDDEAMRASARGRPYWLDSSLEELLDESLLHVTTGKGL